MKVMVNQYKLARVNAHTLVCLYVSIYIFVCVMCIEKKNIE